MQGLLSPYETLCEISHRPQDRHLPTCRQVRDIIHDFISGIELPQEIPDFL